MMNHIFQNRLNSLAILTAIRTCTTMNIIFDLTGVLFGGCNSTQNKETSQGAYAIKLIDPAKTFKLLTDCIKQGHDLYIVSNLTQEWYDFLKADPQAAHLFSYFKDIVLADSIGIKKPDPRIFNHLITKNKLNPLNSIFIDDTPINLKGAEQAGIKKGILCQNFDLITVRKSLQTHGAL